MKKKIFISGLLFCLLFAVSCGKKETAAEGRPYRVYVLNKDETKITGNDYMTESTETDVLVRELLEQLGRTPDKLEYRAPLSGNFRLLDFALDEGQLILNFDERYKELPVTTEVLTRAAIVRTVTQIKGVDYVSFQIKSDPLTDSTGAVVGIMSADMFIDNAGSEINSLERVELRLYFANKDGNRLVETNRKLVYNTNISMEKLVVEQLVGGPSEQVADKAFPTINPATKIISVTVKDGTCYVNFSSDFLTQIYNVTSDVTIYSIANSLVELPNVNKVQLAVNGDTAVTYRDSKSLAAPFERNLDLVAAPE